MSTHAGTKDQADVQQTLPLDDDSGELLAQLRDHLNSLPDATVDEVDTHCCGALGCRRSDGPHWRVDVDSKRTRTLCPTHAVDFAQVESEYDV